jgi:hypothetical protein
LCFKHSEAYCEDLEIYLNDEDPMDVYIIPDELGINFEEYDKFIKIIFEEFDNIQRFISCNYPNINLSSEVGFYIRGKISDMLCKRIIKHFNVKEDK